jgi:hypothetical protein
MEPIMLQPQRFTTTSPGHSMTDFLAMTIADPADRVALVGSASSQGQAGGRRHRIGDDRGSALLMTLGVLLLMLIIGLGFMFSARIERDIANHQACCTRAELCSDSGIQRGLAILEKAGAAAAPISFAPLQLQNLFVVLVPPTDYTRLNTGCYRWLGSDIDLMIVNRSGKLDPNWFGRPTHALVKTATEWRLQPLGEWSTGASPVGMRLGCLDGTGPLSAKMRNQWFVADPELRSALLPATVKNLSDQQYADYLISKETDSSSIATLAQQEQRWTSREQIFKAVDSLNTIKKYDWGGGNFNQDFLASISNNPMVYKRDQQTPDPVAGGTNTFIDWHEDLSTGTGWRDLALLPAQPPAAPMPEDYNLKPRLPVEWFRYLAITPSATPAPADVTFDDGQGGALGGREFASEFQGKSLSDCLPWFRMQYQRLVNDNDDPASYYELAANFQDYVATGSLPTNNLWPTASPFIASGYGAISEPVQPFCGTKAVPSLSEISLQFDQNDGLKSAQVELVNFHAGAQQPALDLNDLAVLIEVEWTDHDGTLHLQKAAAGFAAAAGTPLAGLHSSVDFDQLHSSGSAASTTAKVSRVRAYLVTGTAIGAKVANQKVTEPVIRNSALLDAAVLDIPAGTQQDQILSGTNPVLADGVISCAIKPLAYLGTIAAGDLFVCASDGKLYVATASGLASDLVAQNQCHLVSPQPVPLASGGSVFNVAHAPGANGALYYNSFGQMFVTGGGTSPVATVTSTASFNTKILRLEARDPRNNTRWTYGGNAVWTLGFDGSIGKANLDWWESVPAATVWQAGTSLAAGDRVCYPTANDREYEVLVAHATDAALTPDLPAAATYFQPVWRRSDACGRKVWLAGSPTEDAVAYPGAAGLAAAGLATVDDVVTYCLRPSTAFVRQGQPQSLWELGAINRAEPWRTVRLTGGRRAPDPAGTVRLGDYAMGDWMLLDEVSLFTNATTPASGNGYATEAGKVNPNPDIVTAPGLTQLFAALGSTRTISPAGRDATAPGEAYNNSAAVSCQLVNGDLFDAAAFSYDYNDTTGLNELTPIVSRGELATRRNASEAFPMIDWWNDAPADLDVAGRPTLFLDRNQEELIGKAANLLQTRYQYFEIQATGRHYQGTEWRKKPAAVRVSHATIERDAYTKKLRIINCEHVDD